VRTPWGLNPALVDKTRLWSPSPVTTHSTKEAVIHIEQKCKPTAHGCRNSFTVQTYSNRCDSYSRTGNRGAPFWFPCTERCHNNRGKIGSIIHENLRQFRILALVLEQLKERTSTGKKGLQQARSSERWEGRDEKTKQFGMFCFVASLVPGSVVPWFLSGTEIQSLL
jgi:hypothetical protein